MRSTSLLLLSVLALACAEPNPYAETAPDAGTDLLADSPSPSERTPDSGTSVPLQEDGPVIEVPGIDSGVAQEAQPEVFGAIDTATMAGQDGSAADTSSPPPPDVAPAVDLPTEVAPPPLGTPVDAVILFDEGHEAWPELAGNWARFAADLRADGHTVKPAHTTTITAAALQGVNVLVIGTSWGTFTPAELATIDSFVRAGGGLFLTGLGWSWIDPAKSRTIDNFPMNLIAAHFGIKIMAGYICDPSNFDKNDCQPRFTLTGNHPILAGSMSIGGGITPAPLQATSATAQAIISGDLDSHDTEGVFPAGSRPPLMIYTQHGAGKVIAIGHEGYFTTDDNDADGTVNIDEYDNRRVGKNIIQFLAGYR